MSLLSTVPPISFLTVQKVHHVQTQMIGCSNGLLSLAAEKPMLFRTSSHWILRSLRVIGCRTRLADWWMRWPAVIGCLDSLGVAEVDPGVLSASSQLFFNAKNLVVLGQTLWTAGGASLDLKMQIKLVVVEFNWCEECLFWSFFTWDQNKIKYVETR